MNGIENIIEKIIADANAQKEQILNVARDEAAIISKDYQQKTELALSQIEEKNVLDIERAGERIMAGAELEVRKEMLAEKQAMIDEAFKQAIAHLDNLPDTEKEDLLLKLMIASTIGGSGQVMFAPQYAHLAESIISKANQELVKLGKKGELQLATKAKDIGFGFIISEGALEINCSLAKLIWDTREQLAGEIAEILFAD